MPTIIDSLIMTLKLDSSKFKPQSDEAKRDIKGIREEVQNAKTAFELWGQNITRLFALFTGATGLKELITDLVAVNTQVARLARNLETSSTALTNWGALAARNGSSAEAFNSTIQMLSSSITEWQTTGQTALFPFFRAMDINFTKAKQSGQFFLNILEQMAGWAEGKDRRVAHDLFKQMGIDEGTINVLLQGRKAIQDMLVEQQRLNPITERQTQLAADMTQAWKKLDESMKGVGNAIVEFLEPMLIKLAEIMTEVNVFLSHHAEVLKIVGGVLVALLSPALLRVILLFGRLIGFVLPISRLGLVISLVTGAIELLASNWKSFSDFGTSELKKLEDFWFGMWDKIANSGDVVKNAIRKATGFFGDVVQGAVSGYQSDGVTGALKGAAKAFSSSANVKPGDAQSIVDFLESQGLTHAQASGVAGNLFQESSFNPDASKGNHYGLAQWDPARQKDFKDHFGFDIHGSSMQDQLRFVLWELQNKERRAGAALGASTTPSAAAAAIVGYERPGNTAEEIERRARLAESINISTRAAQPKAFGNSNSHVDNSHMNVTVNVTVPAGSDGYLIGRQVAQLLGSQQRANQADTGLT